MIAQGQFTIANMNEISKEEWTALEKKVDSKIENWFYNGVPTLESVPTSEWAVEDYESHVGDMYYDKDTGYAYRFKLEMGVYGWEQVQDKDTIEALATANAAKDTADGKRRVFRNEPVPPYDNGDLWLNESEIYICQITKSAEETYVDGDFIKATKYTDDTKANQVGDTLTVLSGTVAKIQENVDLVQIEFEKTTKTVDELKNETVEELKRTSYKFDTEDLTIKKSGSELSTKMNEDGMRVLKNDEEMLKANHKGVDAVNLHAKTYLIVGDNSRFEDYEKENGEARTACFWVGK